MINIAASNALMSKLVTVTATTPPDIGYAFTVHQLALRELATNHFLGTIINEDTGAVLEYRHLIKNPVTKSVWETSFKNKIGRLFQGIIRSSTMSLTTLILCQIVLKYMI
jgi:hypothetical protein